MGKKKRDYVVKHKESLGEQLENPETWGVRVSTWGGLCWTLSARHTWKHCCGARRRRRLPATAACRPPPHPSPRVQTQPRPHKRRKSEAEEAAEQEELAQEEFVPAAMTNRILKEARAQQEELDAEAQPAAAAALAASGARGLVAAAAKGLRDSDSEDEFSGAR